MKPAGRAASVAAVVVNYNSDGALSRCVESLIAAGAGRIVVVDNASSDGSADSLAASGGEIEVVREPRNLGYGAAANDGARRCDATYLLISNPDLVVEPSCLDRLAAVLDDDPAVAAAGPLITDPSGKTYPSARSFPDFLTGAAHAFAGLLDANNRWSRRYRGEDEPGGQARDTDWLSGACLLVRKIAFDSLGGFDPGYFMYVEDLDLCWRLRRAGWRIRYEPAAKVSHAQGLSTGGRPYLMLAAHHRSTLRFARKSMTGKRALLVPLVGTGLAARWLLAASQKLWSTAKSRPSPPE